MKAQKLFGKGVTKGWAKLGFKCGDYFVYPSEKLMSELPDDVSSVPENRAYLKVTNCP